MASLWAGVQNLAWKWVLIVSRILTGLRSLQASGLLAAREQRWFWWHQQLAPAGLLQLTASPVIPDGAVILEVRIRGVALIAGDPGDFFVGVYLHNAPNPALSDIVSMEKLIDWGLNSTAITYQSFDVVVDESYLLKRRIVGGNQRVVFTATSTATPTINIGVRYELP